MRAELNWLIFKNGDILLKRKGAKYCLPVSVNPPAAARGSVFDAGKNFKTFYTDKPAPAGFVFAEVRSAFDLIGKKYFQQISKGFELANWARASCFCPVCGAKTKQAAHNMKLCTACGKEFFPQISPAVMVLVRRRNEILMVRANNFKRKFYGLVAGFVEPGETLEQCAAREVQEETNLKIKNLRYFGSHPWPFPNNLMIGFVADWAGSKLKIDKKELSDAGFFNIKNLPPLPGKISLARKMIDAWILEQNIEHCNL